MPPILRAASLAGGGEVAEAGESTAATISLLDALLDEALALGCDGISLRAAESVNTSEVLRVHFYVLGAPVSSSREYPAGSMARLFAELCARAGKPGYAGGDLDGSLSYHAKAGELRMRMNSWGLDGERPGAIIRFHPAVPTFYPTRPTPLPFSVDAIYRAARLA